MSILIAAAIVCGTSFETGQRFCHASVYNAVKPGLERCELQTTAATLVQQASIVQSGKFYMTETFAACYPLDKLAIVTEGLPKFAKDTMGADATEVTSYEFKSGKFVKVKSTNDIGRPIK